MSDVFISYSSSDRERAALLAQVLARRGWSIWWDRTIPPGRQFDDVIEEALDGSKCVVVLWSKDSTDSTWVKTEAAEALRRKILVPAMLEPVKIPLEFRRLQAADLSDWDGDETHPEFEKLIQSIAGHVERGGSRQPAADRSKIGTRAFPRPRMGAIAIVTGLAALIAVLGGYALYTERAKRVELEQALARDRSAQLQAERERDDRARAAREDAERARTSKAQADMELAREQAAREQAARERTARDQLARERQAAKDQAAREQAVKDQALKDQMSRELAGVVAAWEQSEKARMEKERADREQTAADLARQRALREQGGSSSTKLFAAFALADRGGNLGVGDGRTAEIAEQRALAQCRAAGGADCRLVARFANGCGALARAPGGALGVATSAGPSDEVIARTRQNAIAYCKRSAGGEACAVRTVKCVQDK